MQQHPLALKRDGIVEFDLNSKLLDYFIFLQSIAKSYMEITNLHIELESVHKKEKKVYLILNTCT